MPEKGGMLERVRSDSEGASWIPTLHQTTQHGEIQPPQGTGTDNCLVNLRSGIALQRHTILSRGTTKRTFNLRHWFVILVLLRLVLALPQPIFAEAEHKPVMRTWDLAKPLEPKNSFRLGGDIRIRYERIDRAFDLGLDGEPLRDYFRIRPRFWITYGISPNSQLYVRLTNESRIYLSDCPKCQSKFDEIIFDNFFIETRNPLGMPIYSRIGRQDLFYGSGLLICDGGPLDGSRTAYVNGILLSSRIPLWAFDFFTLYNPRDDQFLPRINNRYTKMIENDELLVGIVLRRISQEGQKIEPEIEPYFIYKQESGGGKVSTISTIGLRVEQKRKSTSGGFEFAYQFGSPIDIILPEATKIAIPDTNRVSYIAAFGLTANITRSFKQPLPWSLTAGYINLSGDNPTTVGKFEGWNPVLGRWPKWSELLILTSLLEKDAQGMGQGVAFWQNLRSPLVKVEIDPLESIKFDATYMWLDAASSRFFKPQLGGHKHRGELLTAILTVKTKKAISGHILLERFLPGDFYPEDAKPATFLRFEISSTLR